MAKEHFTVYPRLTYTDFNPFLHFDSMKSYNVIEHGNTAAVRHFKENFLNIKESTVRKFKKKYVK